MTWANFIRITNKGKAPVAFQPYRKTKFHYPLFFIDKDNYLLIDGRIANIEINTSKYRFQFIGDSKKFKIEDCEKHGIICERLLL